MARDCMAGTTLIDILFLEGDLALVAGLEYLLVLLEFFLLDSI